MKDTNSNPYELARWTAPFAAYLIGTSIVGQMDRSWYVHGYFIVLLMVATTMVWLRTLHLLQPHRQLVLPILIGFIGIVAWICVTKLQIEQAISAYLPEWLHPGERKAFDPYNEINSDLLRFVFVAARVTGLAIVVPIIEELFWRGFLMRWLINDNWKSVPLGAFSAFSFLSVVLLFALAHVEWISAAIYGAMLGGYMCWKKDLWGCVVAHSVSNALLAAYVLATRDWQFW